MPTAIGCLFRRSDRWSVTKAGVLWRRRLRNRMLPKIGRSICRGTRCFRHLSPSIVPKRNYLAVDLTVSSLYA